MPYKTSWRKLKSLVEETTPSRYLWERTRLWELGINAIGFQREEGWVEARRAMRTLWRRLNHLSRIWKMTITDEKVGSDIGLKRNQSDQKLGVSECGLFMVPPWAVTLFFSFPFILYQSLLPSDLGLFLKVAVSMVGHTFLALERGDSAAQCLSLLTIISIRYALVSRLENHNLQTEERDLQLEIRFSAFQLMHTLGCSSDGSST